MRTHDRRAFARQPRCVHSQYQQNTGPQFSPDHLRPFSRHRAASAPNAAVHDTSIRGQGSAAGRLCSMLAIRQHTDRTHTEGACVNWALARKSSLRTRTWALILRRCARRRCERGGSGREAELECLACTGRACAVTVLVRNCAFAHGWLRGPTAHDASPFMLRAPRKRGGCITTGLRATFRL